MDTEFAEKFHKLAAIKLKDGETLCTSFWKPKAEMPEFIIVLKGFTEYILYQLSGNKLKKIQAGTSLTELDAVASSAIKG